MDYSLSELSEVFTCDPEKVSFIGYLAAEKVSITISHIGCGTCSSPAKWPGESMDLDT